MFLYVELVVDQNFHQNFTVAPRDVSTKVRAPFRGKGKERNVEGYNDNGKKGQRGRGKKAKESEEEAKKWGTNVREDTLS